MPLQSGQRLCRFSEISGLAASVKSAALPLISERDVAERQRRLSSSGFAASGNAARCILYWSGSAAYIIRAVAPLDVAERQCRLSSSGFAASGNAARCVLYVVANDFALRAASLPPGLARRQAREPRGSKPWPPRYAARAAFPLAAKPLNEKRRCRSVTSSGAAARI